jgi:protein-S-isoprenylcysteine O-methyltransferase Ste14
MMGSHDRNSRPKAADLAAAALTLVLFVAYFILDTSRPGWLTVIGVLLLVLAAALVFPPFLHLSRHGKTEAGKPYFATTRVVDRGVYRIVRHPQYLGYICLVLGFGALNPHPLVLGPALGAAAFFYLQAVLEERYCVRELGSDYERYMRAVPRFNLVLGLLRIVRGRRA